MLGGIFGKKRPIETISFLESVTPDHRGPAESAIVAGRYVVFAPEADSRAVLLLTTTPRLIASVVRRVLDSGDSELIVEWVHEASADHRHHLAVDEFDLSCAPDTPA